MRKPVLAATAAAVVLVAAAAPAAPAATQTMRLFSKTVTERGYDASGAEVTDPGHEPVTGDAFVATDAVFRGTAARHAKKAVGSDHVTCTFLEVALPTTLTGRCDAQIALRGGMILVDRATIELTADRAVYPVTGGTGRYARIGERILTADAQREFWYQPFTAWSCPRRCSTGAPTPGAPMLAEREPDPADPLAVPSTVLWPAHDPLFPFAWSDRVDAFFADATLRQLPDAVHFTPLEAPEAFAEAILQRR